LTLAVEGDPRIRRLELRNGVLVITEADAVAPTHLALTRQELAAFVLGTRAAPTGATRQRGTTSDCTIRSST